MNKEVTIDIENPKDNDLISRQVAIDAFERFIHELGIEDEPYNYGEMALSVKNVPPITPQPKTGHWIMIDQELQRYKCSECGEVIILYKKSEIPKLEKDETLSDYPFSHCGARMVEPQKVSKEWVNFAEDLIPIIDKAESEE